MKAILIAAVSFTLLTSALVLGIFLGKTYFVPSTPPTSPTITAPVSKPLPVVTFSEVEERAIGTVHEKRIAEIYRASEMSAEELVRTINESWQDPRRRTHFQQDSAIYVDSLVSLGTAVIAEHLVSLDERLRFAVFNSWIKQDFEAAAAFYIENPQYKGLGGVLLGSEQVQDSPSLSLIAATFGVESEQFLNQHRLQNMNPLEALAEMANRTGQGMDQTGATYQVASRVSVVDLEAALGIAKSMGRHQRRQLYRAMIQNSMREDPEQTFYILDRVFEGDPERGRVIREFAQNAPQSLEPFLLDYARANEDYTLLINQASRIAQRDTELALQLYAEVPAGKISRSEAMNFAGNLSSDSPDLLYEWVKGLSENDVQMKQRILMSMGHTHANFLEQKLETETNAQMRSGIVAMMVNNMAQQDPTEALELVRTYADENSQMVLSQRVVQQWAQHDPEALFNFAIDQQDELVTRSLNHAALSWYHKDPDAALTFLENIEDEEIRSRTQYGLLNSMVHTDPDRAVVMANNLPPKYRDRARYEVSISLIRRHRGEMEKIITGMQLDEELATRVREYVETNM